MSQLDEPRVLLVNDDPGSLFALQTILSDLDASIVTAMRATMGGGMVRTATEA